jgi:hypothetical protein
MRRELNWLEPTPGPAMRPPATRTCLCVHQPRDASSLSDNSAAGPTLRQRYQASTPDVTHALLERAAASPPSHPTALTAVLDHST